LLGTIAQNIFIVTKRDWVLVMSSITLGVIIPMLLSR